MSKLRTVIRRDRSGLFDVVELRQGDDLVALTTGPPGQTRRGPIARRLRRNHLHLASKPPRK